jgi:alpha-glucoside transport system ATP-binding protein
VKLAAGGMARAAIATQPSDMGAKVKLGVRPEDLVETAGEPLFTGEVDITEALGEVTLLYFKRQGEDAQVVAKLPGIHADLRRKVVKLGADPKKIHLFMNGRSLLYR